MRFSFKGHDTLKAALFPTCAVLLKALEHPEHVLRAFNSPGKSNKLVLVGNSQAGLWERYTSFSTFEVGRTSRSSSITASLLLTMVS